MTCSICGELGGTGNLDKYPFKLTFGDQYGTLICCCTSFGMSTKTGPGLPLEAKKMLLSWAVTEGIGFKEGLLDKGMKIDCIDVRRAYLHAKARRRVFVR